MPKSSREIKRRIRSVKNIGQITKAMELVSAAKMRKAQMAANSSRPYAKLSAELLTNLVTKVSPDAHPLIQRAMPGFGADKTASGRHKVLVVLLSPDKGLAGSLNTNVIAKALKVVKDEGAEKVDFISMGRKGTDALRRTGQNIVAVLPGKDRDVRAHDARPITEIAIADFLAYKYDKVMVVYTDFISTLVQKPNMLQVLPFTAEPARDSGTDDFLFEPSPGEVMEQAIRRYIEFAVYQCMLEAAASEHSARMVAMKNANQSANDLIDELTLSANQARQANITRELSEISAAKIAMEG